jgi:hypothetical protein
MLITEKYLWGNAYNLYQVISHSMICLVFWLDISVISIGIGLAIQAFPVSDKIIYAVTFWLQGQSHYR